MSSRATAPTFDPDFTERVRIGTHAYVLQGIGYPAAVYLFWRIVDAKRGVLDEGYAELADLAERKPWDYGEV